VQRILDTLSSDSNAASNKETPIRCKEYGKAKIYYIDQDYLEAENSKKQEGVYSKFSESGFLSLQREFADLKQVQTKLELENKEKRLSLQALLEEPEDADIDR
jgi:hypothetical protein